MSVLPSVSDSSDITLPERMDMAGCQHLRRELAIASGQPVTLRADCVVFLGGAGAELLLAAQAERAAKGKAFQIVSPTKAFETGLRRLGLTEHLETRKGRA